MFAEVSLSNESLIAVAVSLTGTISFLFYKLMSAKDERHAGAVAMYESRLATTTAMYEGQLKIEREEKKSYKEMFAESIAAMEAVANEKRANLGKGPFKPIAAVVPEHNSPVTAEQQSAADIQTARARLTAAQLELDIPPREPGPPESVVERAKRLALEEPGKPPTSAELEELRKAVLVDAPEVTAEKVIEKLREEKPPSPT